MNEFIVDNSMRTVIAMACAAILAACICRVGVMNSKRHKLSWWLMFACMGGFSLGTAIEVLAGGPLTWHAAAGLVGIGMYIVISMQTWKKQPPDRARKDVIMTPSLVNSMVLEQAFALLPDRMDTPEARCMLLTIGLQESRFLYRRQMNMGPAMGFWQFEKGGGVRGVLNHPASKAHVLQLCEARGCQPIVENIWQQLETDDVFAAGIARLLLWTDPKALPAVDDFDASWALYLRVWRPGKPHPETWADYRRQAIDALVTA